MSWYVAQVLTGTERDVCRELERAGLHAWVPAELRPIHRRGQWTEQEYLLIPSYVFVEMAYTAALFHTVKGVPGVIRLLGMDRGSPAPLPEEELARLGLLQLGAGPVRPSTVVFDAYGTPRIVDGPLADIPAGQIKLDRHARRATVTLQVLGETKQVRLGIRPIQEGGS